LGICLIPLAGNLFAQPFPPRPAPLAAPAPKAPAAAAPSGTKRLNAPAADEVLVRAVAQEVDGQIYHLRGAAEVETAEILLKADEIDYNESTGDVDARGNVYYKSYTSSEEMRAQSVKYNLKTESGTFFEVKGNAQGKIEYRPGLLISQNPFNFQGRWAEKIKNRFILYDGFLTNCVLPKPWWRLAGPKFDIIPGGRAIAYRAVFRVRRVPIFYAPVFYKSLEEQPRKSGFLTPNFGNSTRRGFMYGVGYYWAINRSYDAMYRGQLFTQRGLAHEVNFRGKPRAGTDFNFYLYGVNDRGRLTDSGERFKEGGFLINGSGRSVLGKGWTGAANINYLSSFLFRQAFTQSFNEAIFSAVNSDGHVQKSWDTYVLGIEFSRHQFFQSTLPDDQVVIRKTPAVDFHSRERRLFGKIIPVWYSFDSSAGFHKRREPGFITRQFTDRLNFAPRVMTALQWKGFSFSPSYTFHATHYGSRKDLSASSTATATAGRDFYRQAHDFGAELITPTLERIFKFPSWLGTEVKHVIEPRLSFRHVSGIRNFREIIRFDERDILTSTTEADLSLTNRLYAKRKGVVQEVLTWQVMQRRYFDPTFGGAVVEGSRNVFLSSTTLTGYSFIDRPRHYSPIISVLRMAPLQSAAFEWRTDWDPLFKRVTNSTVIADARIRQTFFGIGHNQVRGTPQVSPNANQLLLRGGIGAPGRRGWSAGYTGVYDFREARMQFATTEISYNSDCCGLSFQYRRFSFGTRNENQYLVSFAIANIGSFGTLRRQERMF
jgi:LPS-assembly protein